MFCHSIASLPTREEWTNRLCYKQEPHPPTQLTYIPCLTKMVTVQTEFEMFIVITPTPALLNQPNLPRTRKQCLWFCSRLQWFYQQINVSKGSRNKENAKHQKKLMVNFPGNHFNKTILRVTISRSCHLQIYLNETQI